MLTMRAIRVEKFGKPNVMVVKEIPVPSVSGSQVLVKINAAGVNPVDTYIREGAFLNLPDLPFTPGKDGAGIVEAVGELVQKFKKGDRVFVCMMSTVGHGTYGEYAVAEEKHTFPLPKALNFEEGAALGIPYFTAHRALFIKGQAKSGDIVLVHGASGAVGLAAVQIAKAHGMIVIGTAGTEEGMELVKNAGADHVLSHKERNYMEKVMELTGDKGVNIILEMLANVNLDKDLKALAVNGSVMVIGCRGSAKIEPRLMMGLESKIIGVALLRSSDKELQETSSAILSGIEKGWVKPVIDKRYSLEQCPQAHHDIIESKGAKGKLVISVCSEK